MILLVESGSTKTSWKLVDPTLDTAVFNTIGLNPIFLSKDEIIAVLLSIDIYEFLKNKKFNIYFYGAGCSQFESKNVIIDSFSEVFQNAIIVVESDIVAAAFVSLGKERGIAGILGTGANVCVFNGKKVLETRSGLGYILGDEGSGSHLGKTFIQDYLNKNMPSEIINDFNLVFNLSKKDIIYKVYNEASANLFFAGFSKYIQKNLNKDYFYNLSYQCFLDFFEIHIEKIDNYKNYELGLVGSVAYFYQDIIRKIAKEKGITIKSIIEKPIDKLADFHLNNR
jgi:N-acetylglucosamine kinase-like BadF-type ATPase